MPSPLSQRTEAKRIIALLVIIALAALFAFLAAGSAKAEDAGATMRTGHTEVILNRNEFDAIFLGKLVQVASVLGALGLGSLITFFIGKRKPSVDVDLSSLQKDIKGVEEQHAAKIEAIEGQVRLIFKKIDGIADHLTKLSTGQATNTANIDDIKSTAHSIQVQLNTLNQHMLEAARKPR